MMMLTESTLQLIYAASLVVLFILLVVCLILLIRLFIKWTKVADLLNKKMEVRWSLVAAVVPYLLTFFEKLKPAKKDKNKK